jgi:hypothetical protein
MFDLEKSIADWRRQMLAAGIQTPVPLDELEVHLREEIERQTKSGLDEQKAFKISVKKFGQARELKVEFKKAGEPMELRLVKLAGIACLVIAGFFSLLILPKLFHHAMGLMPKLLGLAALSTTFFSWRYGHRFLPAIRNWRIRTTIGAVCCLASICGIMLFIKFIPHFFEHGNPEIPIGQLLASFLWAWTAMAILGGMAYGLEKAAHNTNEPYV